MPGRGVRVAPLFMLGIGVTLLWSGITGRKVTSVLKDLIEGKNPAQLPAVNTIGAPISSSSGFGSPTSGVPPGMGFVGGTTWSQQFLRALGAPITNANVASLNAWQSREGGGGANNPLNTTLNCCGGTNLAGNTAGVKNYPTVAAGIQATVATIHGYPLIFMSLMAGRGLCGNAFASEFCAWSDCTHGGYSSVC